MTGIFSKAFEFIWSFDKFISPCSLFVIQKFYAACCIVDISQGHYLTYQSQNLECLMIG